jgi:DNA-binding CsgD family transcriptional regulator
MKTDSPVGQALERLSTLDSFEPRAALEQLCWVLHGLEHASTVATFRPVETTEGIRVLGDVERSSAGGCTVMSLLKASVERWSPEFRPMSATYQADLLRPLESRSFLEMQSICSDEELQRTNLYRDVLGPTRIVDQQRLLVYHDGTCMGWVGFVRYAGEPRFTSSDRRRLAPLVQRTSALVTAAARLGEQTTPHEPADFVLRPDGSVELASEQGQTWLKLPGFSRALQEEIRQMDRGAEVVALPPQAEARIVRLDGEGRVRYLVNVRRCRLLRASTGGRLTKMQREVATLAVSGASAPEIAPLLGVSVNTVRTHLKAVYRVLGVTSRAELAQALGQ